MDECWRHKKNKVYRVAVGSGLMLVGCLSLTVAAAEQRVWINGTAYDPAAKIKASLPVVANGKNSIASFIEKGELTDASGNPITSVEQFNQLRDSSSKVMRIDQKSGRVILNWDSFNIGVDHQVEFVQPSSTALALNKINNSDSPSVILGELKANGGVYLMNPNGIIFGEGAQVNVGSLVASSLDIDDDLFFDKSLSKALTDNDAAAFFIKANKAAVGDVFQAEVNAQGEVISHVATQQINRDQNAPPLRGDIAVLPGAKINTTTLNGAVVVAPNVVNAGEIKTPDGQTILAAAQDQSFVLFSDDPGLRGLLIEVNTGGDVTNLGNIIAERGNVTLAGIAVKQSGTIKATTSVDANGTVRLLARDTLKGKNSAVANEQISTLLDPTIPTTKINGGTAYHVASHGGTVTLSKNSTIEITPELSSTKTAPDAQKQYQSGVEISAHEIDVQDNARITAKGGQVFFEATDNLSAAFQKTQTADYLYQLPEDASVLPGIIHLAAGSVIDVSGEQVDLPMQRNVIEVELRGNELADAPLQRNGFLYGKKIAVDVRKGTPLADIAPALASVPKQVGERLTQGGQIQLRSSGGVVMDANATLDVSGGGIRYAAGYVKTSNLISEGKVVNIANADPSRTYTGILGNETATNKRFNITQTFNHFFQNTDQGQFVAAYDQGASAGSVSIMAQVASLQGTFKAGALNGAEQRLATANQSADGGRFNLQLNLQNIAISEFISAQKNNLDDALAKIKNYRYSIENPKGLFADVNFDTLSLSPQVFNDSGFSHYNLVARNGSIEMAEDAQLQLTDGASLNLFAADHINIDGRIKTAGGDVSLATAKNKIFTSGGAAVTEYQDVNRPITLGSQAVIDTAGKWTNDNPLLTNTNQQPTATIHVDGGKISLKAAGDLLLNIGSTLTANAGGWINSAGKFLAGKGGDVELSAVLLGQTVETSIQPQAPRAAQLTLGARISSYGFTQGGELSITAPSIVISDQAVDENSFAQTTLLLDSGFFQRGGFSGYRLTASGSNEWVSDFGFAGASDATPLNIAPLAQNYVLNSTDGLLSADNALSLLSSDSNLLQSLGIAPLPDDQRHAVNVDFTLADNSHYSFHSNIVNGVEQGARDNNFVVPVGVRLLTDPLAQISFTSNTSLVFDGEIKAPGADVSLVQRKQAAKNIVDLNNFDDMGIGLGAHSLIDLHSTFVKSPSPIEGLTQVGEVIDAGSLTLSAERGFVIAEQGSKIDIAGEVYSVEQYVAKQKLSASIETTLQAAKSGSLSITAAEGVLLNAEIKAQGAGNGALGGTLQVALDALSRDVPSGSIGETFDQYDFSTLSFAARRIVLQQASTTSTDDVVAFENFGKKDAISDSLNGTAFLDVNQLAAAGFDSYAFSAGFTKPAAVDQIKLGAVNPAGNGSGHIDFIGDVALVAGRSIDLNATTVGAYDGVASINAPYIKLGLQDGISQNLNPKFNPDTVTGGSGELQITAAGLLDLVGNISIQGADDVTLSSGGDIRANGLLIGDGKGDNARYLGSLAVNKNLTLQADQIYPSTLSEFIFSAGENPFSSSQKVSVDGNNLNAVNEMQLALQWTDAQGNLQTGSQLASFYQAYDVLAGKLQIGDAFERDGFTNTITAITNNKTRDAADGHITILAGGASSSAMTAGGTLIFDANSIQQNGTVKAPFGRIALNASSENGRVVLGENSLTSVSADNTTIPFGELDAAGALVYASSPSLVTVTQGVAQQSNGVRLFQQSPEAKVVVKAAQVDLQKNATLDLSAGGDLLASRFVPGPGGSKDVLAPENSGQSFAILPTDHADYAAYDPSIVDAIPQHSRTTIGKKVYLSGTGNFPAGEYSVLPARYALLPGAYLVTPAADDQIFVDGQQVRRVDGAPIVAGRFITANTGEFDRQFSGFVIEPGSIAKTRSEYVVKTATELFSSTRSPRDAAGLSLFASQSLNLEAKVLASVLNQGQGSQLDISSQQLLITQQLIADTGVADTLAVQVLADQLIGFDSVLLGGSRTVNSDGSSLIKATAQNVEVAANTRINSPNMMLVAKGTATENATIKLNSGVQINATGTSQQQASNVILLGDSLLSVSSGKPQQITQQTNTKGDLILNQGSSVQADQGAILLLSNNATQLDGDIKMQGGALTIGAGKVSLGEVSEDVTGLKFSNQALANLSMDQLQLTSASSLDLYGDVQLNVDDLTLQASSIRGFNAEGNLTNTATIQANQRFRLLGNAAPLAADAAALGNDVGNGNLNISANELILGGGNVAIAGFDALNLNATSAIIGEGTGNYRVFGDKTFTLNSPLFTGTGAANTQLIADGAVNVQSSVAASDITNYQALGARLKISGQSLLFDAHAVLASGELALTSLGTQGEDLILGANAAVDVAGRAVNFDDTSVASDGGKIQLSSVTGNVVLNENSKLNISGVAGENGSDAGALTVQALAGDVDLKGTINAASGSENQGASLDVAVKVINDFAKLVEQVAAGNFTQAFVLRASSGDITLTNQQTLKARELTLTADNGSITVAGVLDASSVTENGGQIQLNAKGDVNLQNAARLTAASTQGKGGDVFIGTTAGVINVVQGAKINVSGNTDGGSVTLRAPRTTNDLGNENEVAINLQGETDFYLPAVIEGAAKVDVDAFKIYNLTSATSEIFNTDVDGNSTLTEAEGILSYRDLVPFGALCNSDAGCGKLIAAESDNSSFQYYPSVANGEPLPVGSICNDESGCSYRYRVNDTASSIANVETKSFMQYAAAIETRLFGTFVLSDNFHLKPELELRAQNNLTVDQSIDFGEGLGVSVTDFGGGFGGYENDSVASLWRYGEELDTNPEHKIFDPNAFDYLHYDDFINGEAGVLTLRAQQDLRVNAPVSDGFANSLTSEGRIRTQLSNEKNAWQYRFVAGNDLNIADDVVVRTSTGNLDLAAGNDVLMGSQTALYTAGYATDRGVYDELAKTNGGFDNFDYLVIANANYATGGGNIHLQVGNNLESEGKSQYINDWWQRVGGKITGTLEGSFPNNSLPTTWTVVVEDFKQGIATLGGGDVHIDTGGDVKNLAVSLPTTAKPAKNNGELLIQGGGDLAMKVGGDIVSSQFFVARGTALLDASGDILDQALALADGQLALIAGGSISLRNIFNPTTTQLSAAQAGSSIFGASANPQLADYRSNFYTYSDDSSVSMTALSGNMQLNASATTPTSSAAFVNNSGISGIVFNVYPAQLFAAALQGDINIEGKTGNVIHLFPSSQGNLTLLAAKNIFSDLNVSINVPDSDPLQLPSAFNPFDDAGNLLSGTLIADTFKLPPLTSDANIKVVFTSIHAPIPLYANNTVPMRLITQTGDISQLRLITPTHTWVSAGRDINNVTFEFQNVREADVSQVKAGRDILFSTPRNSTTNLIDSSTATQGIDVAGFGRLDVIAGRDISLGASRGIQSIGAQHNPNLLKNGFAEESGAGINVLAGIQTAPDYSAFMKRYFSSAEIASLESMSPEMQRGLILQRYFDEVKQGGINATSTISTTSKTNADQSGEGFARSEAVIATLFPDAKNYQGNINLIFSTIQTQQGGDVNLLAPGGGIDVGAAAIGGGVSKSADKLGLIALRSGSVNATVKNNINVNASRVFALDGGDIMLWSSAGDIDAGRGAKTALSVPAPKINDDGSVNFQAAISGSGIRNSRFTQDRAPGAVYLFAPTGVVNAGDAGIGSQGDVLIAAQQVIGADNIDVGGVSIGIPVTTGVSASVASAGAATSAAADSMSKEMLNGDLSDSPDQQGTAFVTVDILGFDI